MAWLLEVVLTINEVKQGRAMLVLGWVTTRESMALAWKTRGFKSTPQATCCTVASSVYNTHTGDEVPKVAIHLLLLNHGRPNGQIRHVDSGGKRTSEPIVCTHEHNKLGLLVSLQPLLLHQDEHIRQADYQNIDALAHLALEA